MPRAGRVLLLLLLLLPAACSAPDEPGTREEPSEEPPETTERPEEQRRDLRAETIFGGAPGQGPRRPRVVLAPSAASLSEEVGARIPDSGEGTYLVAYRGEEPTGGYSLDVGGARLAGDRVTVRLLLEGPPEDEIVTQALTYPYVVAVVRSPDATDREFVFVDGDGRRLDWPVRRAGG